jgi:hypothetical protein
MAELQPGCLIGAIDPFAQWLPCRRQTGAIENNVERVVWHGSGRALAVENYMSLPHYRIGSWLLQLSEESLQSALINVGYIE